MGFCSAVLAFRSWAFPGLLFVSAFFASLPFRLRLCSSLCLAFALRVGVFSFVLSLHCPPISPFPVLRPLPIAVRRLSPRPHFHFPPLFPPFGFWLPPLPFRLPVASFPPALLCGFLLLSFFLVRFWPAPASPPHLPACRPPPLFLPSLILLHEFLLAIPSCPLAFTPVRLRPPPSIPLHCFLHPVLVLSPAAFPPFSLFFPSLFSFLPSSCPPSPHRSRRFSRRLVPASLRI